MHPRLFFPIVTFFAIFLGTVPAKAQSEGRELGVASGGRVIGDEPWDLVRNSALLGFTPSWQLGYGRTQAWADVELSGHGDGLYLVSPSLLGLATGLSFESIRPTVDGLPDVRLITFGLGWAGAKRMGIGASLRFFESDGTGIDGHTALDLGAVFYLSRYLGFSAQVRDIGSLFDPSQDVFHADFELGLALAPLGSRRLLLELDGHADDEGSIGARAALSAAIPGMGRIIGAGRYDDLRGEGTHWQATAGLRLDWENLTVGAASVMEDNAEGAGSWFGAAISGAARDGLFQTESVRRIEVSGLGERGMAKLVVELDHALHDEMVDGLYLLMRGGGVGSAYAQEIRLMIAQFRASGKKVVCHLEQPTGSEWYACANATETWLEPAGAIFLLGPSSQSMYLGGLLSRLGVRTDFVRIGDYKSFPEEFANRQGSAPALLQSNALVSDAFTRLTQDMRADLSLDQATAASRIDGGPYLAVEALEAGLVDALVDEFHAEEELAKVFGSAVRFSESSGTEFDMQFGSTPGVAVVMIDGSIVDGENVDIPFVGVHMTGGRTIAETIDGLAADPSVRAIVVRVDSGGGSATASDQMWRAITRARARKPVVASMGAVAASGGYYAASAANEIWADPSTVTGSIGILYGKVDVEELASRIGIHVEHLGRGRHAGATSIFRPLTGEERALVADKMRAGYRLFLRRVAEGRGKTMTEIDRVARGRVWSGDRAHQLGLVDHLGGLGAAIARARILAGLPAQSPTRILPRQLGGIIDFILGDATATMTEDGFEMQSASNAQSGLPLPWELRALLERALAFQYARAGLPLAIMPEIIRLE